MKALLVDGNNLMFRAYYATAYSGNIMQTSSGKYSNAIYGFAQFMKKIAAMDYDFVLVAFDTGVKTFRHKAYAGYKAGRKKLPEEMEMQIPYIKELVDLSGFRRLELPGYEADDIIASAAKLAEAEGVAVDIISGDKDLFQMVSPATRVLFPRKGMSDLEVFDQENFFAKLGIRPGQVTDYKGLVGDNSDNLPGVTGVGPKRGAQLLQKYGTLEAVLAAASEQSPALAANLQKDAGLARQCKQLAELICNLDLGMALSELAPTPGDQVGLAKFYEEFEIKSLIDEPDGKEAVAPPLSVTTLSAESALPAVKKAFLLCDCAGENYFKSPIIGFSLRAGDEFYFLPPAVAEQSAAFRQLLTTTQFSVFNGKQLAVCLARLGLPAPSVTFDFQLAAYVLDSRAGDDEFASVARGFTAKPVERDSTLRSKKASADDWAKNSAQKLSLLAELEPQLTQTLRERKLTDLADLEIRLSAVLATMEFNGLYLDRKKLAAVKNTMLAEAATIEAEIYQLAGERFNLNSPAQLGRVLFEKLQIPPLKKTKTGYSTAASVLEQLAPIYPIARLVLDYREVGKLISTYLVGLEEQITAGFIHPLYKQALTTTGRLSSVEPNIQNMPIRKEKGKVIRSFFTSRFPDGVILSSDYSQIELRILAHLAQDEAMIALFKAGADFHRETAAHIYGCAPEQVTSHDRSSAKAINFGIVYGMSPWGLSQTLGISVADAENYIAKYFAAFPAVKRYLDNSIEVARSHGYAETMFGRRRYIPELAADNRALREFGERTALNSPLQGAAADIIKKAMVELAEKLRGFRALLIAQVHDELILDVPRAEVAEIKKIVKAAMEQAAALAVPLEVSLGTGKSWLDIEK